MYYVCACVYEWPNYCWTEPWMSVGIIPDATRRWNGALLGHREKVVRLRVLLSLW